MDKYTKTKELFEKNRDNENAIKMSKYMRDMFKFYGLATPKRKSFYKELLKEDKTNKVIDWEFLDKCYEDEYREFQYLVMDYLVNMQKYLRYAGKYPLNGVPKMAKISHFNPSFARRIFWHAPCIYIIRKLNLVLQRSETWKT